MLDASHSDEKLQSKVFQCLGSWLALDVIPQQHLVASKLLSTVFAAMVISISDGSTNLDLSFKAKAKDLSFKAKAKDLSFKFKAKDLTYKAKAKNMKIVLKDSLRPRPRTSITD